METDQVKKRLEEERDSEGITCAAALKIAEELGVPPREIGKRANRLGLKIRTCRLGCF